EVTSEGSFDRDFSSFEVANFTDQNDVRILAQKRTQRGRKVQADLFLHLHLVDAEKIELDRVLRGHDVGVDCVQRLERRVERVRLTASRWTSNQHHPVRLRNISPELRERLRLKTELGHVEHEVLFVQQAEHDFFAKQSGESRNAEVEFARTRVDLHFDLDTAVLRQTLLGDVELRHDLDARDQSIAQLQRRMHHVVKHTVDTEPDAQLFLIRFDVNVGGATAQRVNEEHVDQAHDGRVLAHLRERREIDLFVVFNYFDVFSLARLEVDAVERDEIGVSDRAVAV